MNNKNNSSVLDQRIEERNPAQLFVELKAKGEQIDYKIHAFATDYCGSGVTLRTYAPIPVGTPVELTMGGALAAKGEVTNLQWDRFGGPNKVRLGVHFIEKNENWPLY
jgi:hypothetical protein